MPRVPDELPPSTLLASLPWWVVLEHEPAASPAYPSSLTSPGCLVLDTDGVTCLAVFTDEDLAERFVRAANFPGRAVAAREPEAFLALLRTVPPVCTYAAFDPPAKVGARARWVVPLEQVRGAMEFLKRETEG